MARFFFDVHNAVGDTWDDEGHECADRGAIEAHACQLLAEHDDRHDGGTAPVSISVLDDRSVVLTAVPDDADGVKLLWMKP